MNGLDLNPWPQFTCSPNRMTSIGNVLPGKWDAWRTPGGWGAAGLAASSPRCHPALVDGGFGMPISLMGEGSWLGRSEMVPGKFDELEPVEPLHRMAAGPIVIADVGLDDRHAHRR